MALDPTTLAHRTFAALDNEAIAAAYNVAYTDYVMPFVVDAAWAASSTTRHDINSQASSVWYLPDSSVAALAVLGQRGADGWVGGFGLAPALRGQGLSTWLINATIASARTAGISRLWLEVITTNTAAIRVYERAGFRHVRNLLVLRSPADAELPEVAPTAESLTPMSLTSARERRDGFSDRPAWQRVIPRSVRDDEATAGYAAWLTPDASGLLITTAGPTGVRIADVAADTNDAAVRLLQCLTPPLVGWPAALVNEPEGGAIANAAHDNGWTLALTQYEMVLTLD